MQLDFIPNYNSYNENLVRLCNFSFVEAQQLRDLIEDKVLLKNEILNLNALAFIEAKNCSLRLRISETDEGILTVDNKQFFCCLTANGFQKMLQLMQPFCIKDCKAYQWLYDLDCEISFLFTPSGSFEIEE
jgi:hypothetical protein